MPIMTRDDLILRHMRVISRLMSVMARPQSLPRMIFLWETAFAPSLQATHSLNGTSSCSFCSDCNEIILASCQVFCLQGQAYLWVLYCPCKIPSSLYYSMARLSLCCIILFGNQIAAWYLRYVICNTTIDLFQKCFTISCAILVYGSSDTWICLNA